MLGRLFAVAEAYPELQADENFRQLQTELAETENRVAVSRQVYNDAVLTYHNAIQTYPGVVFAGPFGFNLREFFEVEEAAQREAPVVDFWRAASPSGRPRSSLSPCPGPRGPIRSRCSPPTSASTCSRTALGVSERLEVVLSGDFHFGYRDIPLRPGESFVRPSVVERGVAFRQGTKTDSEPGPLRTFGVERNGDRVRIVWYFDAANETRAFTISYTLTGVAVAYDDVVDVNLKVWGDQWDEPLARLEAAENAPGKILRAWGKPVWVRGDVELGGNRATLRAVSVPARQFVELRTLVPRDAFTSTTGMASSAGTRSTGSSPRSSPTPRRTSRTRTASTTGCRIRSDSRSARGDRAPPGARRDRCGVRHLRSRATHRLRP